VAGRIRRLELRLTGPGIGINWDEYVHPILTILIDGQDVFTSAGECGNTGWPRR
jgi:hypothetical protein